MGRLDPTKLGYCMHSDRMFCLILQNKRAKWSCKQYLQEVVDMFARPLGAACLAFLCENLTTAMTLRVDSIVQTARQPCLFPHHT